MKIDFDTRTMDVDNHVLETYRTCEEKYRLSIKEQWVKSSHAPELAFGLAMHSARAQYKKDMLKNGVGDLDLAVDSGLMVWDNEMPDEMKTEVMIDNMRSRRNFERLARGYFAKYGGPEFKPLHVETPGKKFLGTTPGGWHVNYVYTIDEVVEHNGRIYPLEFKTTSGWTPPDARFFSKFDNSSAITGYIWAVVHHCGLIVSGAIIHAMWVHAEPLATSRSKYKLEDYFKMSYTYRDDGQIEEWKRNTLLTCDDIVRSVQENRWKRADGHPCNLFSGCQFKKVCEATPASRERLLEMDYIKHSWNPWERLED